jgi:hypothetical protein
MPKRSGKKTPHRAPRQERSTKAPRGVNDIPNKASIVATDTFVSPKGRRYTILETDQTDPYDVPAGQEKKRRDD